MLNRFYLLVFIFISPLLWGEPNQVKTGRVPQQSPALSSCTYFLPYNPIVVEIGAGTGNITKYLASLREKATVYSFEADMDNFNELERLTQDLENVFVFPFGISNRNGKQCLYKPVALLNPNCLNDLDSNPSKFCSFLPPASYLETSYHYQTNEVECKNLQDWCYSNNIPKIDVLYLDVCGYEMDILQSSKNIINTATAIYVTTYDRSLWRGQGSINVIDSLLQQSGFILYTHWYEHGGTGMALYLKATHYRGVYERKLL